ncbi:MAG: M17 family peptidase N-terminal domain-containing protein [Pyrinomonadaceae bacterium]
MEIQTTGKGHADVEVEALAVAVFKDEKADEGILRQLNDATGGVIASVIESGELKGKEGETIYVHLTNAHSQLKAKRLLLIGVGVRSDYQAAQTSQMAGIAVRALRSHNVKTIGLMPRAGPTI